MIVPSIFKKHASIVSFLIILISSLSFRVTNLNLIEFKSDEAINIFLAAQPLLGHSFLPGGTVSSLGVLNPPIFNYILFPITLISLDPRIITLFMALANVAGILGFFLLLKKYYGLATATIASLLLSFSPWAILYSRKIWMQDLLVPLTVLMLLAVHKLIVEKKEKYWILYIATSLVLIQLHQVSVVFIAATSLFMFRKVKLNFKFIIWGAIIGLIPLIPYIIFEIQNGCPDCYSFLQSKSKLSPKFSMQTFMRPFQILGVGDFRSILGDDTLTYAQKFPFTYKARQILYLEYLLLPFGFAVFMSKNKKFSFLGYATLLAITFYFFLKIESFMHYYIIFLPLLFLFLAFAFSFFLKSRSHILRIGAVTLLSIILLTSAAFTYRFFDLLKIQGKVEGDYGSIFINKDRDVKERLKKYDNDPHFEERILASYIPLSYMYGYEPFGKMLYGDISLSDTPMLEMELRKDPEDKIAQLKLLNLHTRAPETVQTIYVLRSKTQQMPEYLPIYREVLQRYMGKNFKKDFYSSRFAFFYPEHWIAAENSDGSIILNGNGYEITIKNLGLNNMEISCTEITSRCDSGNILEIKNSIKPLY